MAGPLEKIVIVGGGTAGWISAAVLARFLRGRVAIELVESEDLGTIGVGEATVPIIRALNGLLGIEEGELLRQSAATFKLGIEFRDWCAAGGSHFHFFGDFGADIDGIAPHHHWLRLRALGDPTPLGAYSFPYVAGRLGRFAPPASEAGSPAAAYRYAYHLDATGYARCLRAVAERNGVRRTEGLVADVRLRSHDGFIAGLTLADGRQIDADLFIDASGFRARLIAEALQVGYESWSQWLPCDRAVVVPCERGAEPPPYTVAMAQAAGWQWRIPLQQRLGNGYVYSSRFLSDEHAAEQLAGSLKGPALGALRQLRFTAGLRRNVWVGNCIAIGLAAGFLEPLESSGIQLIQNAAARLIEFLPDRRFDPAVAAEYNRLTRNEYERIRDFLILHYCLSTREDTEFWRYCRDMPLPETLCHKIEVWRACAKVPLYSEESYREPSWVSIFLGMGCMPKRYDPQVEGLDAAELRRAMQQRRERIEQVARTMPTHQAFIERRSARSHPA